MRWAFLTAASFVFYGYWDWRFLALLVGSGMIDFLAGLGIEAAGERKGVRRTLLTLSIIANVGSLAIFKYLDFGIDGVNAIYSLVGNSQQIPHANLLLPVGISFYTFQSMSYTIDVYLGRLSPCRNILHFFSYLSMFPQLVAGPIERASHLLPQLAEEIRITRRDRWEGLKLIAGGYFKKVVIADTVAVAVNVAYGDYATSHSTALGNSIPFWWLISLLFAIQIYCDFAGYTDIARGLARWMGFQFGPNFNHPYTALGFSDFWSRWHISLSTWFRDYVYIPLGGSRGSSFRVHGNLWITMLVSGLWHGAAMTFVVWGACHAFLLSIERITGWPKKMSSWLPGRFVGTLLTFAITLLTWVAFRAESLEQMTLVMKRMLGLTAESTFSLAGMSEVINDTTLLWAFALLAREAWVWIDRQLGGEERRGLLPRHSKRRFMAMAVEPIWVGLLLAGAVFFRGGAQAFIYFQF